MSGLSMSQRQRSNLKTPPVHRSESVHQPEPTKPSAEMLGFCYFLPLAHIRLELIG